MVETISLAIFGILGLVILFLATDRSSTLGKYQNSKEQVNYLKQEVSAHHKQLEKKVEEVAKVVNSHENKFVDFTALHNSAKERMDLEASKQQTIYSSLEEQLSRAETASKKAERLLSSLERIDEIYSLQQKLEGEMREQRRIRDDLSEREMRLKELVVSSEENVASQKDALENLEKTLESLKEARNAVDSNSNAVKELNAKIEELQKAPTSVKGFEDLRTQVDYIFNSQLQIESRTKKIDKRSAKLTRQATTKNSFNKEVERLNKNLKRLNKRMGNLRKTLESSMKERVGKGQFRVTTTSLRKAIEDAKVEKRQETFS